MDEGRKLNTKHVSHTFFPPILPLYELSSKGLEEKSNYKIII